MPTYFESTKTPIFAAEFDYFRLPRPKWELMLLRLYQLGANALMLNVPWGFHEPEPGLFDLTGATGGRRDLTGLLALSQALGLPCLLRIGPYLAGSGVLGDGLPAWLLKEPGALDEQLPGAIQRWYQALGQALTSQQWPDGPIIALQINSGATRPPRLSSQLTEVKWPIWLRKRYQGIEAINAAYGSHYRSVSEVTFPESWAKAGTPLEQDAQAFLTEMNESVVADYTQVLVQTGWHIPIQVGEGNSAWPTVQNCTLSTGSGVQALAALKLPVKKKVIVRLTEPVEIDAAPVDVSAGPGRAAGAPIRFDGSVRRSFWQIRPALWSRTGTGWAVEADQAVVAAGRNLFVTNAGEADLKVDTVAGPKTRLYRLRLTGEVVADDNLKVVRKKLTGRYQVEDTVSQIDGVLLLEDTGVFNGFLATYLKTLLNTQLQALGQAAMLAETLGQNLSLPAGPSPTPDKPAQPPAQTSYILSEARRGLREADAALRRAMASIGGLEGGFATILGQPETQNPTSAPAPVAITPAAFEGQAQDTLVELGATCREVAEGLRLAIQKLQPRLDSALTLVAYQEGYQQAAGAAQAARAALLPPLAALRLDLASEQLPLVVWRVHDQVQAVVEGLRWGVLRGG